MAAIAMKGDFISDRLNYVAIERSKFRNILDKEYFFYLHTLFQEFRVIKINFKN